MREGPPIKPHTLARDYDPTNKAAALPMQLEAHGQQEFLTGLIYINESRATLPDLVRLSDTPLADLPETSRFAGP